MEQCFVKRQQLEGGERARAKERGMLVIAREQEGNKQQGGAFLLFYLLLVLQKNSAAASASAPTTTFPGLVWPSTDPAMVAAVHTVPSELEVDQHSAWVRFGQDFLVRKTWVHGFF